MHLADSGKIVSLGSGTEIPSFSPKAEIIVFQKSVATVGAGDLEVYRLPVIAKRREEPKTSDRMSSEEYWKDFERTVDDFGKRLDSQASGIPMDAERLSTLSKPVKGQSEMVKVLPSASFEPGLYMARPGGLFYIEKEKMLQQLEQSAAAAKQNRQWLDAIVSSQAALRVSPDSKPAKQILAALPTDMLQDARLMIVAKKYDDALKTAAVARLLAHGTPAQETEAVKVLAEAIFENPKDGTLIDRSTGLMWATNGQGTTDTLDGARAVCSGLSVAGHKDWRLPTYEELTTWYVHLLPLTDASAGGLDPLEWIEGERTGGLASAIAQSVNSESDKESSLKAISAAMTSLTGADRWGGEKQSIRPVRFVSLSKDAQVDKTPYLLWAVEHGYPGIAQAMILAGADLNVLSRNGDPVLSLAIENGAVDIAAAMIKAGANVNGGGERNRTPLAIAIDKELLSLVGLLLDRGADTKKTIQTRRFEGPPACVAVQMNSLELVKMLAAKSTDFNAPGRNDKPPLALALQSLLEGSSQAAEIIDVLLEGKADPNWKDRSGITVFLDAVGEQKAPASVIEAMLKHGADAKTSSDRTSALGAAMHAGAPKTVRLLLEYGADPNEKMRDVFEVAPLLVASSQKSVEMVRALVEHKADVNVTDHDGQPLLMRVCNRLGNRDSNAAEIAEILLNAGANPNAMNRAKHTVLYEALQLQVPARIVELMIKQGADVNAPGAETFSGKRLAPLTMCRRNQRNPDRARIEELLIRAGAKDPFGPETKQSESMLGSTGSSSADRPGTTEDKTTVSANRGYIGIKMDHAIASRNWAEGTFPISGYGVWLDATIENGPASKAGIQAADLIAKIDGVAVKSMDDLRDTIGAKAPGDRIVLEIYRPNPKSDSPKWDKHVVEVEVTERPTNADSPQSELP